MQVRIRPMEARDFEAILDIYPPEWTFAGCTPDQKRIQARMDMAMAMSHATLRWVAVEVEDAAPQAAGTDRSPGTDDPRVTNGSPHPDGSRDPGDVAARMTGDPHPADGSGEADDDGGRGTDGSTRSDGDVAFSADAATGGLACRCDPALTGRVVGMLIANLDEDGVQVQPDDHDLWCDIMDAQGDLLAGAGEATEDALAYVVNLPNVKRLLKANVTQALPPAELSIFIVDPNRRGNGAGGALMRAFEGELARRGVGAYWLETDDTCSLDWYEARGYRKVSTIVKPPLPHQDPALDIRAYIYTKETAR